jgi:2,5-diamino-6-(ribosylamino)-4(3H)-pyrimidinone 5'-phosphate reductase
VLGREARLLPRVGLHVEASLDGRIDWIQPDIARFYALAAHIGADAILTGADTLLQSPGLPGADDAEPPEKQDCSGDSPLLVVVDSRGRFRLWNWLRKQVYWRDAVAVLSAATPNEVERRLSAADVATLTTRGERVDLREALEQLADRFAVRTVRVDSGGALSGALLRAGLLDEISLLLEPRLVGGQSPRTFLRGSDPVSFADVARLQPISFEQLDDGALWLRYAVERTESGAS